RCTAVTRDPRRRSPKSWGPPAWSRMARASSTVTSVIVRPVTCVARPRRTTSTSGSSGTVVGHGRTGHVVKSPPGDTGDLLLGFFLRRTNPTGIGEVVDLHRRGECFVV